MTATLMRVLEHYGYLAVFLLVMLEDFGLPTPGETALIAASALGAAGRLNIWGVVAAAVAGAIIGDNIGYAIGHFGGRKAVLRWGGKVGVTAERYKQAEGAFHRFGDIAVAGARFVEVLRQLNGIIAGTMGMHWATFLAFNSLGAVVWVGVWSAAGYFAGRNVHVIVAAFRQFSWLALIGIVVGIAIYLYLRWKKEQRAS